MQLALPVTKDLAIRVAGSLAAFAEENAVPPRTVFAADHALTEHLQNIIDHSDAARVEISVECRDGTIEIVVGDDGSAFDPTLLPPPRTDAPLEDRPIGGLGVHMMRRLMDEVRYERRDGWNRLRLVKSAA